LKKLWAYSIIFEISYKLDNPDFQEYLDTHHRIVFELLETFEKEKILIAYPTQVVYTPDVKSK
jgi:small-conductance mechanosensitive channel